MTGSQTTATSRTITTTLEPGELVCRVAAELVEEFGADWEPCDAFKFERVTDDEVVIHVRSKPADGSREDIYRKALEKIADENSGVWGRLANEALKAARAAA